MQSLLIVSCLWIGLSTAFVVPQSPHYHRTSSSHNIIVLQQSSSTATELPDSLEDAAERAAIATQQYVQQAGPLARCRIDFDTSIGDETFPLLKTSTEFMQNYVSATCYALIPGLMERKQQEMMRVVQARAELQQLQLESAPNEDRLAQLSQIIAFQGRNPDDPWTGPTARIYFPDEGNAALARRDWLNPDDPKVPPCVECASCGGVQTKDTSSSLLVFFFCPKASESEYVEEILQQLETTTSQLQAIVFVNPNLVDMGVTGFGMAGRRLRERLLDTLTQVYYLRTLPWGALTRLWPQAVSVWQEDESAEGGYRLIRTMDRLPSNPEVEDIYDIENGNLAAKEGGGLLDQFGDFVNGMMRL